MERNNEQYHLANRRRAQKGLPPKSPTTAKNISMKMLNAIVGKFLNPSSSEPTLSGNTTNDGGSRVPGQALGIGPSQARPLAVPPLTHLGRPNNPYQAHIWLGKNILYHLKSIGQTLAQLNKLNSSTNTDSPLKEPINLPGSINKSNDNLISVPMHKTYQLKKEKMSLHNALHKPTQHRHSNAYNLSFS